MSVDDVEEFSITFPPNARIAGVTFVGDEMHVRLEDGGAERIIASSLVAAIHGAAIRREMILRDSTKPRALGNTVVGLEPVEIQESLQYVLAIRATSIGELWYFVADSFNFRMALGADADLTLEHNFRALVRKLVAFAPRAVQDAFVTALLAGSPAPPPLESLMDFLRIASR